MPAGIEEGPAAAVDIVARTVVISNLPRSWLSSDSDSLAVKVSCLLEKFGKLRALPDICSSICKLGSTEHIAYATFNVQDEACRAVKYLHGADNRSGDEERLANYALPNEREKYYVQMSDCLPPRPDSEERPSKAARIETPPHFLRVGMPRLPAEMPDADALTQILQKQLLIISQCALPAPYPADERPLPLLPPRPVSGEDDRRLTLVLDLDGTLVECRPFQVPEPDTTGMMTPLTVHLEGKPHAVYFRPKAQVLLATVAKLFEVVVFTASIQSYADQVLDHLDPERKFISARLYREHCTPCPCGPGQVIFLKDMSILGRPLERVVLVDDSPISHIMTPDNGIAVSPWSADQTSDGELLKLLISLRECQRHALETGSATDYLVQRYGLRAFFDHLRTGAAETFRAFCELVGVEEPPPPDDAIYEDEEPAPEPAPPGVHGASACSVAAAPGPVASAAATTPC